MWTCGQEYSRNETNERQKRTEHVKTDMKNSFVGTNHFFSFYYCIELCVSYRVYILYSSYFHTCHILK